MSETNRTLKQKAYQQFKEFLLVAFYLWLVFGLLELHKSMILAEHHINFMFHGFALINAWALAKVMIVVRHLHWGEQFDERPLIYPTLLKAALFTVVLACFKLVEDTIVGWLRGESFRHSIADFGGGTWQGILTLTTLVFVLLIPFVGYGELRRVLGEGRLEKIFFHRRPQEG